MYCGKNSSCLRSWDVGFEVDKEIFRGEFLVDCCNQLDVVESEYYVCWIVVLQNLTVSVSN